MVHGTSTMQKANEKTAAKRTASRKRRQVESALRINVVPIAAAKSPESGRNKTASPASKPVTIHQMKARLRVADLKATVAVSTIATARKFVGTAVRIVAT